MRSALSLSLTLLLVATAPLAAQNGPPQGADVLTAYRADARPAIRPGEVRSAAFLTESHLLTVGQLVGGAPRAVKQGRPSPLLSIVGATVKVAPPAGATWHQGDMLVFVRMMPGAKGWGDVVIPTGLARVGASGDQATVTAVYGPILTGQAILPMAATPNLGTAQPKPASGPSGTLLFGRDQGRPRQPGGELFVDLGSAAGIAVGDVIEFRRAATTSAAGKAIPERMLGRGTVVHVGEKSSTVRLYQLVDPKIPAGTMAIRVATLAN